MALLIAFIRIFQLQNKILALGRTRLHHKSLHATRKGLVEMFETLEHLQ